MAEQLIVSDPKVMMGKPVVSGTRMTVELILEELAAGETIARGEVVVIDENFGLRVTRITGAEEV